jgi:DNA-binding response OmpR family regulator
LIFINEPLYSDTVMERPPRILVVDDQADFRAILQLALESAGFQLTFADSGFNALKQIAASPPDLVLLDMRMPEMDGVGFLRKLRGHDTAASLPVVFLTGSVLDADELTSILELDPADFITKSVSARELVARIRWVLRRTNQRPAA